MKDENKKKFPVDLCLLVGLVLYWVYIIVKRHVVEISDVIAYPWMIVSCVMMIVGVYRTGKILGGFFNKK